MYQKNRLRSIIIEEIIRRKTVTRREIAEIADTRLPSVTEAVNSLLHEGILEEPSRKGVSTGRKSPALYLRGDHGHFLGISLSQKRLHIVLINTAGDILDTESTSVDPEKESEAIFQQVQHTIETLLHRQKSNPSIRVLGTGFADPGLVDEPLGISIKAVHFTHWENIPTREYMQKRLGCPVYLRTEMASRAYAERLLEGKADSTGTFHFYMGDGIGGAYTRGLEIFTGDSACPMEIGHLVVEENGALCQCGNRGCLEAYAGSGGIARRIEQLKNQSVHSLLVEAPYSPEYFVHVVRLGDKAAIRLVIETAQYIGKALAATTNLLNPGRINLSGTLLGLHDLFLPVLRQFLTLHCLPQALGKLEWQVSRLPESAPAIGAALIARHCHLKDQATFKKKTGYAQRRRGI